MCLHIIVEFELYYLTLNTQSWIARLESTQR
jgi:hypothetical protein